MLVTVIPARKPPVWSAIPKVGFPQNQADSSLVLWEYVSDPDDADALLTFEVTNLEDIDDYSVNYRNGRLYLSDTDNLPGWDRLTVTAYDPDGNNSTAQFLAFVAPADGTPIVGGIPDTTIVAGTQRNWIDLDDFYYDVDNTDYEMTWTWGRQANEDSSVTVSINMFSHVAHLASYDEDVFGINRIFFTVTDPDEKFADDICIILVIEDLYKPTLNLPPKIGFVAGTQKILDLDDYVLDLQYLKSELNWSWTGNSNASITTEEPDLVNTNPVSFSGPSDWTGWESVIFNVTNPIDGSAQDTLTVFSVSDDGTPVAGGLTDLTLNAGECIYVNLNDFFYDANSMDYEMTWTVTGNDSINVNIDPVTHIAQICALSELWSGQELFTFTVTDPESNFDTMNVRVIVTNPFLRNIFSAMIFRNPMQEDYMDIYIKSKIDILTLPSLKIQSELDTTSVSVQLVTKNLFYGRYLLTLVNSLGVKGIADVIMSGTTLDQMSIQDTTHFAYGRIDDDGGKIALGKMNLSVPAGALEKPVFITVVPGEIEEKQLSKTIPDEVVFDNITYTVGPSTISSTVPLSLLFSINQRTEGAGIYRLNDNSWEFIGADYSEGAVQAGIFGGDTFVLGYDRTPPRVVIREVREGVVVLSLADYGCGINEKTIRVSSDGMELPWKFDSEHSELAVSVTGHTPDENISLDISVDDLSGNTTHEAFSTQIKAVPGQIFVEQNSPNPFNPLTTISFVITSDQTVKIEVYNIMGQKVKVLVDDFLAAGRHSVVWNAVDENGSSVSSGMYLYRVTNGTRLETRKMLLIR